MSLKKTVDLMQSNWDKSEKAYETMFGGAKVPAGTYNARLSKCHRKVAKSSENAYLGREFTILDGEHEGATVYDRIMLHNDTGPVFARRFIAQAGFEAPKKVADLEKTAAAIQEAELDFKIQVKHSDDFVNVNVLSLLSEADENGEGNEDDDDDAAAAPAGGEGAEGEGAEGGEEDEEKRTALLAYAQGQEIEVDEELTLAEVVAELSRYDHEEEKLTAEEVDLLEQSGLAKFIVRKKPATPPRTPAKAAAKPAAASAKPTQGKAPAAGTKKLPGKAPARR